MKCPACGRNTGVFDSRPVSDHEVRRRRECSGCRFRFTTVEIIAGSLPSKALARLSTVAGMMRRIADEIEGGTDILKFAADD